MNEVKTTAIPGGHRWHGMTDEEQRRGMSNGPRAEWPADIAGKLLGDLGQVYISHSSSAKFAEFWRCEIEPARRMMTIRMLDAKPSGDIEPDKPRKYRLRDRDARLDIVGRVVHETHNGRSVFVVISATVRR